LGAGLGGASDGGEELGKRSRADVDRDVAVGIADILSKRRRVARKKSSRPRKLNEKK
jgi:hypothetical protein